MPADSVAFAGGTLACAQSFALVIANPLIGRAVGYYGDYTATTIVIGLWTLPGALAWLGWRVSARFT